ncbi:DNA repair protein RecO [Lachnospiraceae bacterium C1.1]|nr:DNA repair protein RecO [Lachnospiraceae bacterium C1.1]
MSEAVKLTGIILRAVDYSEYDRRLVLLTAERGKITAFAHGVRRSGNRFMAATEPFAFGNFSLGEGRTAYNLRDAEITNYFEGLRGNLEAYYLGSYFLELAEYYTRENNDDLEMLKLLYQSLRALISENYDNYLVKAVYEIKTLVVNGEFPGIINGVGLKEGTVHAINYIFSSPVEKLYNFKLREDIEKELKYAADIYTARFIHFRSKSLEVMRLL